MSLAAKRGPRYFTAWLVGQSSARQTIPRISRLIRLSLLPKHMAFVVGFFLLSRRWRNRSRRLLPLLRLPRRYLWFVPSRATAPGWRMYWQLSQFCLWRGASDGSRDIRPRRVLSIAMPL